MPSGMSCASFLAAMVYSDVLQKRSLGCVHSKTEGLSIRHANLNIILLWNQYHQNMIGYSHIEFANWALLPMAKHCAK